MAYMDPYGGNMPGVLAKFGFKEIFDDEGDSDGTDVGFQGDLEYAYSIERFDPETMEGNVWVWVSDDADVDALKAHSSFVGTSLLKDIR